MRKSHLIIAAAIGVVASHARGQTSGSWTNLSSGTWAVGANWSSSPLFPDGGGSAAFGGDWNSTSITIANSVSVSQIVFDGLARFTVFGGGSINFTGPVLVDVTGAGSAPLSGQSLGATHRLARARSTAGITKSGPGTVYVETLNITGGIRINDGTMLFSSNLPLGSAVGSITLDGGALHCAESLPINQPLIVGAAGGTVVAGNFGSVQFSNDITGSGPLVLKSVTANGFRGTAATSFTGALSLRAPLTLTQNGSLLSPPSLTISSVLSLDSASGGVILANRVSDTALITLRGGTINGSLSTGTEQVGTVTLASGLCGLGSALLNMSTPAMLRPGHAVLGIGTPLLVTSVAPTLSGSGAAGTPDVGIIPWARREAFGGHLPVTYEAGAIRPLSASEFVTTIPAGVSASNLQLTSSDTIASPVTVNSLTIVSGSVSTLTLSGPATLTVSSGGVFTSTLAAPGPVPITISAPLNFGSVEGVIHTPWPSTGGTITVDGPISGTSGLTIAGGVRLFGTSTYTGPTTILGNVTLSSSVIPGQPGPLGNDTSAVSIEGGARPVGLMFANVGAIPMDFARDLVINHAGTGSVSFVTAPTGGATPNVTVSGNIELDAILTLRGTGTADSLTLSGNITGSGAIQNPNFVTLSGNNTFSGGVELLSLLAVASDTALGTGTLWMNADNVQLACTGGAHTLTNPTMIMVSGARFLGPDALTLTGTVDLLGGQRAITLQAATTTFSGRIVNGGLTKNGTGLLQVSNIGLPTLNVNQGQLKVLQNGTSSGTSYTQSLTVTAGASLDLTDNDFILDYTGGTPAGIVRLMIMDGRITSSLADATTHTLGYADNALLGVTSFSGRTVDSSSVLIKYTWFGDADLDGDVDVNDLGILAANWQGNNVWMFGDFDYNSTIDVNDLGLLATNWQAGVGAPLSTTPTDSLADALASFGLLGVTVPEPAGVGLVLAVALTCHRRRRIPRIS